MCDFQNSWIADEFKNEQMPEAGADADARNYQVADPNINY
jgi:hypothetical protein